MLKIGFCIVKPDNLIANSKKYHTLISKKKFTSNWSVKMKNDFLNNNLNYGLAALENNAPAKLHFEVWGNQKKLNPEHWLTKK